MSIEEPVWADVMGLPTETQRRDGVVAKLTDPEGALTGLSPKDPTMVFAGIFAFLAQQLGVAAESIAPMVFRRFAKGVWLDLHAELMDTARIPAAAARGNVTLTLASGGPILVSAGHVVTNLLGEPVFTVDADVTLEDGVATLAAVTAAEEGTDGNVPVGALTVLQPAIPSVTVTNLGDWLTSEGRELETDAELGARLDDVQEQLAKSDTVGALTSYADEAGATTAAVLTHARGQGTVDVVILGPAGLPSSELIAAVQAEIEESRSLVANILVRGPTLHELELELVLKLPPTGGDDATIIAAATKRLSDLVDPSWIGVPGVEPFRVGENLRHHRLITGLVTLDHVLAVDGLPSEAVLAADEMLAWSSVSVSVSRVQTL